MKQDKLDEIEDRLRSLGRSFPYPNTPDLTSNARTLLVQKSRPRTLQWGIALLILLIFATGILTIPPVRAAVQEYIQFGAIRILLEDFLDGGHEGPSVTVTPPDSLRLPDGGFEIERWQELAGEVSLAAIEGLPELPRSGISFPDELGPPDKVYLQENGGPIVLLLWKGTGPNDLFMSIMVLGPGAFVGKGSPATIQETSVWGLEALWLEGDHDLFLLAGDPPRESLFRVLGNVLIWEEAGLTYRLEGDFSLEEASRIAESLR
jgi:hypothetical protein